VAVLPDSETARDTHTTGARQANTIPANRTLLRIPRDPLKAFEEIGRESRGEIARLDLGLFRRYLVKRPQYVVLAEAC
jgi:hypothetical protein